MYSDNVELDKFYTKESISKYCISKLNLNEYDFIIEPSAGSGSFYKNINHNNKIGLDLKPEYKEIKKKNWFLYKIPKKYNNVLIIGNPPFGKRNKLSIEFIKHSSSFANVKTIAFILPNVYKKHTLQRYIPISYRLKEIIEIPDNSFEIEGKKYHVPCSFFIFDKSKGECLRFNPKLYIETNDWYFSNKFDYDFFIMGASPKVIKKNPEFKNRGYYIKLKDKSKEDLIKSNFEKINWNGNSSVNGGVSWFTKAEIVKGYIEEIK